MRGTGRIFRRGKVWWIAYCYRGREFRESSKSQREADAKRLLRKRLGEIHAETFVAPSQQRVPFAVLLDDLLREYELNGRRNIPSLKGYLKHICQHFALDRAIDITETRIERYKSARLAEGAANASVNRELATMRRAFSLACKRKILQQAPRFEMLREDNVRENFVERAAFEALVSELPPAIADFARFGFLTGWRKGEISSLRWGDVDLSGRTIRLRSQHSKNRRSRLVALEGDLLRLIQKRETLRRVERPDGTVQLAEWVFHDRGRRIGDFRKTWNTARQKAGLPGLLFHDLRRSAVRNMVRGGTSERICMEITGHRTRSIFQRYDIVDEKDIREAIKRTQAYIEAQPDRRKVVGLEESQGKGK